MFLVHGIIIQKREALLVLHSVIFVPSVFVACIVDL